MRCAPSQWACGCPRTPRRIREKRHPFSLLWVCTWVLMSWLSWYSVIVARTVEIFTTCGMPSGLSHQGTRGRPKQINHTSMCTRMVCFGSAAHCVLHLDVLLSALNPWKLYFLPPCFVFSCRKIPKRLRNPELLSLSHPSRACHGSSR